MKRLARHLLDARTARDEWNQFNSLMNSKVTLSEAGDILPFFKNNRNLSLLLGYYFPSIRKVDVFAHEYVIYGDYRADLVIGDLSDGNYLLVEFEDGSSTSIFKRSTKANSDWSPRFEAAFSQLVDWLWKLEDMRNTMDFQNAFGHRDARFHGLIVTGKGIALDAHETARLKWRQDKVLVDSKKISCVTFERLKEDLDYYLSQYHQV